jgi:hypothetical protein
MRSKNNKNRATEQDTDEVAFSHVIWANPCKCKPEASHCFSNFSAFDFESMPYRKNPELKNLHG